MSTFYVADKKNIVEVYGDASLELSCSNADLKLLPPNTVDAAKEKHVPAPTYDRAKHEVKVEVGTTHHPMTEEHLIEWVMLVTKKGSFRINLAAVDEPVVTFRLSDGDEPINVLAYCNLHGLWQADIQ